MNTLLTVDQAILQRRSVRGFLPDEVPQSTLDEVFGIAQRAPSNCNMVAWSHGFSVAPTWYIPVLNSIDDPLNI